MNFQIAPVASILYQFSQTRCHFKAEDLLFPNIYKSHTVILTDSANHSHFPTQSKPQHKSHSCPCRQQWFTTGSEICQNVPGKLGKCIFSHENPKSFFALRWAPDPMPIYISLLHSCNCSSTSAKLGWPELGAPRPNPGTAGEGAEWL